MALKEKILCILATKRKMVLRDQLEVSANAVVIIIS